jgi:hypothetical protein
MQHWGVVRSEDDDGTGCNHVVPLIEIDGQRVPSCLHILSPECPCHPFPEKAKGGWTVWMHYDPDHPGGLTLEQWLERRKLALTAK